jgi:nucleoside-diphosphate-sugar epimerase
MRVLLTGASGCIGAWIARFLLEAGHEVVALDLDVSLKRLKLIAPAEVAARVLAVEGSIEDRALLDRLIEEHSTTHVCHLAALLIPVCQRDPVLGARVNVLGTLNLFEAARASGRGIRVVYASSAAVWGPPEAYPERALTEADPLLPATFYGVFKQSNEQCARIYAATAGVASIGLRPWTVYGPGRDFGLTSDPTHALRAAVMGRPFRMRLTGLMDLQYVEDVAMAFVRCLESDIEGAHAFNLAGHLEQVEALIPLIERLRPVARGLITCEGPTVPVAARMDGAALARAVPGIPLTSLEEGVGRSLALFERLHAEGCLELALPE